MEQTWPSSSCWVPSSRRRKRKKRPPSPRPPRKRKRKKRRARNKFDRSHFQTKGPFHTLGAGLFASLYKPPHKWFFWVAAPAGPGSSTSQAAEKVSRFVGRAFSHDIKSAFPSGVLTPEDPKGHFSATCKADFREIWFGLTKAR